MRVFAHEVTSDGHTVLERAILQHNVHKGTREAGHASLPSEANRFSQTSKFWVFYIDWARDELQRRYSVGHSEGRPGPPSGVPSQTVQ